MNSAVREALAAARERLEGLDPYAWGDVEVWVASVRPLIVAAFPDQVGGFDLVTRTPRWVTSPIFASTDRYGQRRDNFAEAANADERANRRTAAEAKEKILACVSGLLALSGLPLTRAAVDSGDRKIIIHNNYGEALMSDRNTISISNSNVGAAALGRCATSTGSVSVGSAPVTQEQHRKAIADAQGALIRDQDALDKLDACMFEALGQFLRLAREIQVEQKSLAELQAKMKETLDEVWAEHAARGMKPQLLPKALEVAGAIAKNPVLMGVASKLIGV